MLFIYTFNYLYNIKYQKQSILLNQYFFSLLVEKIKRKQNKLQTLKNVKLSQIFKFVKAYAQRLEIIQISFFFQLNKFPTKCLKQVFYVYF